MKQLPAPLLSRLASDEAGALVRLADYVEQGLADVYREALLDHRESLGEDAQFFGFKIYKRLRFAIGQLVADETAIQFVVDNGAYELAVGPLRIRIDALGHFAHEDVLSCFPDASPTKRAVGLSNARQLRLDIPEADPVTDTASYLLDSLTFGHFGNSREGLVKWYLGAWTTDVSGKPFWAWIDRLDEPDEGVDPIETPKPKPLLPFSEREADSFSVRPKRSA